MTQASFDFDELTREPYTGRAPLGLTFDYFTPDELLAAHDDAHRGWSWGMRKPRTWRLGITTGHANDRTEGHDLWMLDVDLRCDCRIGYLVAEWEAAGHRATHCCIGELTYQANCPPCRWMAIAEDENAAVEAWHDHAWPGWQGLPVIPRGVRPGAGEGPAASKRAAETFARYVAEHYPEDWQRPGAPIVTERAMSGTRHVPRLSPWHGYDLAAGAS